MELSVDIKPTSWQKALSGSFVIACFLANHRRRLLFSGALLCARRRAVSIGSVA